MQPNDRSSRYEICIQGHLEPRWLRYFEDLEVSQRPDGITVINGVMDQSALHGILNRIRDLSLVLVSVQMFPYNIGSTL